MIKTLKIKNFQKHGDLEVSFSPTITTIIGSTDAGKSSILRALRWACLNQPQGDGFRQVGKNHVSAQITTDQNAVRRYRDDEHNLYELDGKEFRSFGTGVPETIQKALNVGPINFQGQHDAPFWFSLSAGEVSRELNAVVDLDIIDRSLAFTAKNLASCRASRDIRKTDLEDAKRKKESLSWVPEADKQFSVVKSLRTESEKRLRKSDDLSELLSSIRQNIAKRDEVRRFLEAAKDVYLLCKESQEKAQTAEELKTLLTTIRENKKLSEQELPDLSKLESLIQQYNEVRQMAEDMRKTICDIKQKQVELIAAEKSLSISEELLKEFKDVCEVCGRPLE